MRRLILIVFAIIIANHCISQNKKSIVDLRKLVQKKEQLNYSEKNSISHEGNISTRHSKAMNTKCIGTSPNVYTLLMGEQTVIDVNNDLNMIMFTHRQGGAWGFSQPGGSSADLYCKYSVNNGQTWDSVAYLHPGQYLIRYPNGVIYNPPGNTNPDNAYAIVCGPTTSGTGWNGNLFGSIRLDGAHNNYNIFNESPDSIVLVRMGLSSGNGNFHVMATVNDQISDFSYYKIYNGTFNTTTHKTEWTYSYVKPTMKSITYDGSYSTYTWAYNGNIAFSQDGLHGYVYTFGADTVVDPYHTSIPNIWETYDGGATWTKRQIFEFYDQIQAIRDKIWPTLASSNLPNSQQIFRPDFPCGYVGSENIYPGVVDANGQLHIACIIKGRYSSHPDSMEYSYANHPNLLFDVFTTPNGMSAVFIDTMKTNIVTADNSGYGTGTDAVGWDHKIQISRNADGTKIFVTWTDTDPAIDTCNLLPEPKCWSWDITSGFSTPPISYTTGYGNTFFPHVPKNILDASQLFSVPLSFIDIFDSNQNPNSPIKHYYQSGIDINNSDYSIANCTLSAYITAPDSLCNGDNINLIITPTNGTPPYAYEWSNNLGTSSEVTSATGSAASYSVTVTDADGCTIVSSKSVYVYTTPIVNLGQDITICHDTSVTLHAGNVSSTYQWNVGSINEYLTISEPGTYSVVVSRCGLSSSDSINIYQTNCFNSISGLIFKDLNWNSVKDANEPVMPNVVVKVMPGNLYFSSNNLGIYTALVDTGTFTISIPNPPTHFFPALQSCTVTFNDTGMTSANNDFAMFPDSANDVAVYVGFGNARPGFDVYYNLHVKNHGNTVLNGKVKFLADSLLNLTGSFENYNISGDTVIINYSGLDPGAVKYYTIMYNLPATVELGTILNSIAIVTPIQDDNISTNNFYPINQVVTGSFDPNDKNIIPQIITPEYASQLKPLMYTIRFQNTGTDTAFNIKIIDTLCENVNPASFQLLASSHTCNFRMFGHGIIEFKFPNILLADSNTNEPLSHGFVIYSVKPKDSLDIGDTIKNTADIYFDFNLPVRTNTVLSKITDTLLYTSSNQIMPENISVYPNPFTKSINIHYTLTQNSEVNFDIFNIIGEKIASIKQIKQKAGSNSFPLDLSSFNTGVYFLKININSKIYSVKIVKNK